MSYRLHLALLLTVPVLTLLTPTVKDRVLSLFMSSSFTEAYVGDGILIGDSATNVPFSTINWMITQQPIFGDTYHTVSIFVVPERVARRHLYPYESRTETDYFPVGSTAESNSIGMRSYIYLLPKMYLQHEKEAKVEYMVEVKPDINSEPLGAMVFQFQNRDDFSNYVDQEPNAYKKAVGCSCMLGDHVKRGCRPNDKVCIKKLKESAGCLSQCYANPFFTSEKNSYNFFSAYHIPVNYLVRYNISILMYFYNHTMFGKYYKCTICGQNSCSFSTAGFLRRTWLWRKRDIIIAYVHPTSVPSLLTTRLSIDAQIQVNKMALVIMLCLFVAYLVIKHCLHICRRVQRKGESIE